MTEAVPPAARRRSRGGQALAVGAVLLATMWLAAPAFGAPASSRASTSSGA